MRHLSKIIASTAAVVLSGVALVGPSAAPAEASGNPGYVLFNNASIDLGDYYLHAHAHNFPVNTTNDPNQTQYWDFINRSDKCLLGSTCNLSTAWEIQLEGTGECLNFAPGNGAGQGYVFLDSCQPNDLNELFWQVPLGNSVYYYRNVEGSYLLGNEYSYMTALGPHGGHGVGGYVDEEGPGAGDYARWFRACVVSC